MVTNSKKSSTNIKKNQVKSLEINNEENNNNKNNKTLSDELNNLVSNKQAKSFDPESVDVFGDQTKSNYTEDFGDITDSNKQGIRIRGDLPSTFSTGKYSGKKTSRKDEISEDELDQDEMMGDNDDDDEELEDRFDFQDSKYLVSSNVDKADLLSQKLLNRNVDDESDDDQSPNIMTRSSETDELTKSIHTKNQSNLYDELLGTRIHLQKCLNLGNKLPKCKYYSDLIESSKDIEKQFREAKNSSFELLNELYSLQSQLCEQNQEVSKFVKSGGNQKKRLRDSDSLQETWKLIESQNEQLFKYHTATIDRWNSRVNVTGQTLKKNLKSINQSINTQIDNTLKDFERLQKRTRLNRSRITQLCEPPKPQPLHEIDRLLQQDQEQQDEYLDEIFDDSDFYQLLLKELIESTSASDETDGINSKYWTEINNLKKKKKKVVNQKASKGRILRYEVFPKLENFMTPVPAPIPTWNINQLYKNLFGSSIA
ncbi:TRAUB family protein [Tieghemostelium lacteum]|uniref:TRAUB family protein n=1 Tax=Tieghemostelium lacteum TaxID=361077 RepID=A0A152A2D5_TIELA|nr:TRAUB family protein [Tieghemostelium lacteum]|eukprot:KYR00370.1 TRAUB family protein [Tieghemostelium lacteum]